MLRYGLATGNWQLAGLLIVAGSLEVLLEAQTRRRSMTVAQRVRVLKEALGAPAGVPGELAPVRV